MKEYEILGVVKARELLMNDKEVYRFLTYMGLFTKEIKDYLMENGLRLRRGRFRRLFPHKHANALSTKIAGDCYKVKYGKKREAALAKRKSKRMSYPGMCIYYDGDFFSEFSGYPRIIFEVLDSSVRSNAVNLLAITVEKGSTRVYDFCPPFASVDKSRILE